MDDVVKKLNELLSDLNVFYRKLQNYHWNIVGAHFFVIHSKLEEYYDEINKQIDEVAEHILMMDQEPLGTMKDYLENSCIEEAKNEKVHDNVVFENVIKDYSTLLQKIKDIKKIADEQNLYETSTLMDDYMADYTKVIWMLKQTNIK